LIAIWVKSKTEKLTTVASLLTFTI